MATFNKTFLSGSTYGRPISITATAPNSPQTIHVTGTSTSVIDEVWLWVANSGSNTNVTIKWGNNDNYEVIETAVVADSGLYLVVPGLIASGNGTTGFTIAAWAGSPYQAAVFGYVNRIS